MISKGFHAESPVNQAPAAIKNKASYQTHQRQAMREAVIVSTARTPLTKSHRGEFNVTPAPSWLLSPSRRRWSARASIPK
jgi:hypothetical protein